MKQCVNSKYQHTITNTGCGCALISVASMPKLKDGLASKQHFTILNVFQLAHVIHHQTGEDEIVNDWMYKEAVVDYFRSIRLDGLRKITSCSRIIVTRRRV